jgi:uroporphyrinogen decarboxylase
MNKRQNLLSLIKRSGFEKVPIDFNLCPSLYEKFSKYAKEKDININNLGSFYGIPDLSPEPIDSEIFKKYYTSQLKKGTVFDDYGVAHEPGSEAAFHMTKMLHPMEKFDSVEQVLSYPYLDYSYSSNTKQKEHVSIAHKNGMVSIGYMQCTIWETSWYLRGMENLMVDMMNDDPMAEVLLDKITHNAAIRTKSFAESGVDAIFLGDDVGTQNSIMMSERLYIEWIKPRLKKVIDAAKSVNPDVSIFYHTCGYVTPFIPHLIDVGVDVLNPVQPECMDFDEIHAEFGDRISFFGTIGTQTTMPFGTPDEVRREVFKNLDIAGVKGGLLVAPTHVLEPEVPIENVFAYIQSCYDYK